MLAPVLSKNVECLVTLLLHACFPKTTALSHTPQDERVKVVGSRHNATPATQRRVVSLPMRDGSTRQRWRQHNALWSQEASNSSRARSSPPKHLRGQTDFPGTSNRQDNSAALPLQSRCPLCDNSAVQPQADVAGHAKATRRCPGSFSREGVAEHCCSDFLVAVSPGEVRQDEKHGRVRHDDGS